MSDALNSSTAGLYVHVPFCAHVCPYCDFAVLIADEARRQTFVEAIAAEAARYRALGLVFDTIYLGGGTPSSLLPAQLETIVASLKESLSVDPGAALYLEVNPEDVSAESIRQWRELGFTTLCLGVQSFDNEALRFLDRRHSAADARDALSLAGDGGFETVSIDMIYGFHGQSAGRWRRQLDEAVSAAPDHISCYQLTIHDGTVFGRRRSRGDLAELPEDRQAEHFLLTHAMLADAGYEGYELSNFARDRRHRSAHNIKYWNHTPYLGLGPSAHSFVEAERWWNHRKLRLWQRELDAGRTAVAGSETLSNEQLGQEEVMLGLRTADGVDLDRLRDRYGVDLLATNSDTIERWIAGDRLRLEGATLRPTVSGMAVADAIVRSLEVTDSRTPESRDTYTRDVSRRPGP
jgi:oxygen-independent coproporphyrinogen-3 oxidase